MLLQRGWTSAVVEGKMAGTVFHRSYSSALHLRALPNRVKYLINSSKPRPPAALQDDGGHNGLLTWEAPPTTALIVRKFNETKTWLAAARIVQYLKDKYPHVTALVEDDGEEEQIPHAVSFAQDEMSELSRVVDMVICCGGDGTILHAATMFEATHPPVLAFAMGNFGFLTNFKISKCGEMIDKFMAGGIHVTRRSRLQTDILFHNKSLGPASSSIHSPSRTIRSMCLNETVLHRGANPSLIDIQVFLNDIPMTNILGDGVIVSSPTGSTGYSLSAGSIVVHPSLKTLLLTPVSPRSLSFRPLALAASSVLRFQVRPGCRHDVAVTLDGRKRALITRGDTVIVQASPYPVPIVSRVNTTTDWIEDLTAQLLWNQPWPKKGDMSEFEDATLTPSSSSDNNNNSNRGYGGGGRGKV